jgi:hypothetical protein
LPAISNFSQAIARRSFKKASRQLPQSRSIALD